MGKVSVITPLHNKGPYVERTIASLQAQTIRNWELIVVENHSNDDGPDRVALIAREDDRLRLIRAPDNVRGPGAARNCGLTHATGEWVLFLDADDLVEPNHLLNLLAVAEAREEVAIVAGHWQEFTDADPRRRSLHQPSCYNQPPSCLQGAAIAFAPWAVHAALVKRSVLIKDYQWPEELDRVLGEDIHFWFKLVCEFPVAYSESADALYRTHTRDRRNQLDCIEKWFHGLDAAVEANVSYLKAKGLLPDSAQCDNLVRLYSGLYRQALRAQKESEANAALKRADSWFHCRRRHGEALSLNDRLRQALGLKIYIRLSTTILGLFLKCP